MLSLTRLHYYCYLFFSENFIQGDHLLCQSLYLVALEGLPQSVSAACFEHPIWCFPCSPPPPTFQSVYLYPPIHLSIIIRLSIIITICPFTLVWNSLHSFKTEAMAVVNNFSDYTQQESERGGSLRLRKTIRKRRYTPLLRMTLKVVLWPSYVCTSGHT